MDSNELVLWMRGYVAALNHEEAILTSDDIERLEDMLQKVVLVAPEFKCPRVEIPNLKPWCPSCLMFCQPLRNGRTPCCDVLGELRTGTPTTEEGTTT